MTVFLFFLSAAPTISNIKTLLVFWEYAYDYTNNCLLLQAGKPYLIEKDEALKIWIYHALKVPRYVFAAHSWEYGNELEKILGRTEDKKILESEIQRYITEAVMVNPYIQELNGFEFEHEGAKVVVKFEVTTIYGRFTHNSEVYNE